MCELYKTFLILALMYGRREREVDNKNGTNEK